MLRAYNIAGLACAALVAGCAAEPDTTPLTLTILHTNDFHSRIEPINKYDSSCKPEDNEEGKCFGGSARLATAVADRRGAIEGDGGYVLLVDGGDQFSGTLFYTYYQGAVAAEMMNALDYDAMTVGNHEFDNGPEVLRGFIEATDFPILLANADISGEPELRGDLKPSTVINKGGARVGLIGLAPADTDELSSPGPNVKFGDPIAALQSEVANMTAKGVNKIVLLSHSGYLTDQEIAANVAGIDVIVGGHDNTYLSNTSDRAKGPYPTWVDGPDGNRVAIVQAYAYGKFLGELQVDWDGAGVVTRAEGEPLTMDAEVAEDDAIKTRVAELAAPLDEIRNEVVGETAAPIDGDRANCRAKTCEMGVLVAEAMLDAVADEGIDIAIQNGGGLRASIDQGEVTRGEVLTVLPFQNTLSTFKLTGADVVAALENGVSKVEEGGGRFPQVAGLRYAWSPSKPAGEGRVRAVQVKNTDGDWVNIDQEAEYGVVSNNFMRSGGDGYSVFAEKGIDAYDFGPDLADVVIAYMQGGPYVPAVDDRIIQLK